MMPLAAFLATYMILGQVPDDLGWAKTLFQYGIAGCWLIWFAVEWKDQKKINREQLARDDKRHQDNLSMQRSQAIATERLSVLIAVTLSQIKDFSPHSIDRIVLNASEEAKHSINELSRTENGVHP